nr:MAG TPA: hypothetical protein [Caudoviricetes sp.]
MRIPAKLYDHITPFPAARQADRNTIGDFHSS